MTINTLQEILDDNVDVIKYHTKAFVTNSSIATDEFAHAQISRCVNQLQKLGYKIQVNIALTKVDPDSTGSGGV